MTIKELIASKLRPIGDAIREKDGSTELIPIDDMPQAIRDIQGSATVTKKGGWVGTQVQNSGVVENIYFNTSLTKEEVHNILSGLNFANVGAPNGMLVYIPFMSADYSCNIEIDYYPTTNEYTLSYVVNGVALRIFDSTNHGLENGWDTNYFIEVYNVNSENVANSFMAQFSVEMQNDKLTNLISTTPFEKEADETVTLSGEYDGTTIFLSNKIVSEPTVVPNSGTVEKVYFNTNLSVEEVVSLISGLIYYTLENQPITYSILASSDWLHTLNITNENGNYTILKYNRETNDLTIIWTNYEYSGDNLSGWREVAKNAISFECEVTNTGGTFDVGAENDKLANLISITPFEVKTVNNFNIDIKSMLEEKKLPLSVTVNVESESVNVVKQGGWVGTQVPNSGTVENVYFNTNLTYDEVANILSKLTYFDIDSTTSYCWLLDVPSTGESIFAQASTLYGPLEYSLHYIDKDGAWNNIFDDTNLWNSSLLNNSNYISINAEVSDNHALDTVTLTSGLYNNLITELFSSVDFIVEVEDSIVLEGTYDGSTISTNGESAIDITSLLQQKQLPLVINVKAIETVVKDTTTEDALLLRSLTEYSNDRVTSVGAYAFMYCNLLRTVNLPLVTSVGNYAFMNCTSMKTINISNLESIGTYAFNVCGSLKTLRTKAKHIGRFAFSSALTTLIIDQTDIVCELEDDALVTSGLDKGAIYVPDSMVDSYKADRVWSLYTIKPLSEYVE